MKQVTGWTQGFTLVLAGLKALLEHNIRLNLAADRDPKGIEERQAADSRIRFQAAESAALRPGVFLYNEAGAGSAGLVPLEPDKHSRPKDPSQLAASILREVSMQRTHSSLYLLITHLIP